MWRWVDFLREGSIVEETGAGRPFKNGFFRALPALYMINYLKEVQAEMRHVNWPNRRQITLFTVIVIVVSFVAAYYLGAFDALFSWVFENYIL